MKITLHQKDLLDALNIVSKGISVKNTMEILKGVFMETDGTKLILNTNNLETGICTTVEAFVQREGTILVDEKIFENIIRRLPPYEVNIEVKESNKMTIQCGSADFCINGMKDGNFPKVAQLEEGIYQTIPGETFVDMVNKTSFAASMDENRPDFMGEILEFDEKELIFVAVDGYRMAKKTFPYSSSVGPQKVLILRRTMEELKALVQNSGKDIQIALMKKEASFLIGETIFNTRLIQPRNEIIQYNQMIPKDFSTTIVLQTKEFFDCLERADLVSKNHLVRFHIHEDKLSVTARDEEIGNLDEDLNIQQEGADLEIGFNIRYFVEALKRIESEKVQLHFNSSVSPCILRPHKEEDYTYLVLPVRLR